MKIFRYFLFSMGIVISSCSYLDIVPDNIATIDYAFADETTAERYLLTCYAGMPKDGEILQDPALMGSDEIFTRPDLLVHTQLSGLWCVYRLQKGEQNSFDPYINMYEGLQNGVNLWITIRRCYVFQENIDKVLNLREHLKMQWIAESKCIIAYCYYTLLKMYGPVPIIDKAVAVDADVKSVRYCRSSFDECVDFVVKLLDDAYKGLQENTIDRQEDLGRFNQCINLSLKAKLLVLAASPLFNGNPYLLDWKNKDGKNLISPYDVGKWEKAKQACMDAILLCEKAGFKLYKYPVSENMNTARYMDFTFRNIVSNREWGGTDSPELIWGSVMADSNALQYYSIPMFISSSSSYPPVVQVMNSSLRMVNLFYTANGIPVKEDPTWNDKNQDRLRAPKDSAVMYKTVDGKIAYEQEFIEDGEKSLIPELYYQREPRFYTSLAFNRCKWYGNGKTGDDYHVIKFYRYEPGNLMGNTTFSPATCVMIRKLTNINSTISEYFFQSIRYPFPIIRLADIYLLYAECANEVDGPTADAKKYLDLVRKRAGLKGVDESWENSNVPDKPTTQEGLRDIIHTERMIELAFEGKRYWDLRRWLKLETIGNEPIYGYNTLGEEPDDFWQKQLLFQPKYTVKDYLSPIRDGLLILNPNLVQAKGW